MDFSNLFDMFSAAPIFIAYYSCTDMSWWHFFIPFVFVSLPFSFAPDWLYYPRQFFMFLLELCLFFVLSQGVNDEEVQSDGFRISYVYVPIVLSWISISLHTELSDLFLSDKNVKRLSYLQMYTYLLLTIHAAATNASGQNTEIPPEIRWPTLLLLSALYMLPSPQRDTDTNKLKMALFKIATVLFASIMLQLQNKDSASPGFDLAPVDFRVLREPTSTGNLRHVSFLARIIVLFAVSVRANVSFAKADVDKSVRPFAVLTTVVLACAVANRNSHFMVWALLAHAVMLIWYRFLVKPDTYTFSPTLSGMT